MSGNTPSFGVPEVSPSGPSVHLDRKPILNSSRYLNHQIVGFQPSTSNYWSISLPILSGCRGPCLQYTFWRTSVVVPKCNSVLKTRGEVDVCLASIFGWILLYFWMDMPLFLGGYAFILGWIFLYFGVFIPLFFGWILLCFWMDIPLFLDGYCFVFGWIFLYFWMDIFLFLGGYSFIFGWILLCFWVDIPLFLDGYFSIFG